MISELVFIRSYNTFWNSLFPGGDDYVRLINSILSVKFENPLTIDDIPNRRALVNGISFSLFELVINNEMTALNIDNLSVDNPKLNKLILIEKKALSNLSYGKSFSNKELMVKN